MSDLDFRPAYKISTSKPGSDVAAETAAALAASSIFYKSNGMASDASNALSHAKTLYNFAKTYKGAYSDQISDAAIFYKYFTH